MPLLILRKHYGKETREKVKKRSGTYQSWLEIISRIKVITTASSDR